MNYVFDIGNIVVLYLISRKIFQKFSLIPVIIYAILPWNGYLLAANSFYIFILFLLFLIFYGFLLTASKFFFGALLIICSTIVVLYSSFLLLLLIPLLFISIVILRIIPLNKFKLIFLITIISLLPLIYLIYKNGPIFQNIASSEISIFSDPGLLNMVNSYQGAANKANLRLEAKISENKYLVFTEYVLLKFTKHLVPSSYFTPQEKLLNFSFAPPLYFGFIIPFYVGLYQIFKPSNFRKLLFLSMMLTIPSVLAKPMVDLNRLLIFMPIVILLTAFGLIHLLQQKKRLYKVIFSIVIILVAFQAVVTISDVGAREKLRFSRYHSDKFEVGRQ